MDTNPRFWEREKETHPIANLAPHILSSTTWDQTHSPRWNTGTSGAPLNKCKWEICTRTDSRELKISISLPCKLLRSFPIHSNAADLSVRYGCTYLMYIWSIKRRVSACGSYSLTYVKCEVSTLYPQKHPTGPLVNQLTSLQIFKLCDVERVAPSV